MDANLSAPSPHLKTDYLIVLDYVRLSVSIDERLAHRVAGHESTMAHNMQ
jgi:hypothetical protein